MKLYAALLVLTALLLLSARSVQAQTATPIGPASPGFCTYNSAKVPCSYDATTKTWMPTLCPTCAADATTVGGTPLSTKLSVIPVLANGGYNIFPTADGNAQAMRLMPMAGGVFAYDFFQITAGSSGVGPTLYCNSQLDAATDCNIAMQGTGSLYVYNWDSLLFSVVEPSGNTSSINNYPQFVVGSTSSQAGFLNWQQAFTISLGLFSAPFKVNIGGGTALTVQTYGGGPAVNGIEINAGSSGNNAQIVPTGAQPNITAALPNAGYFKFINGTSGNLGGFYDGYTLVNQGFAKSGYSYSVPATGGTVTMSCTNSDIDINPAGTIAALTVNLCATPVDGQEVTMSTTNTVTALTVSGNGHPFYGAPTTINSSAPWSAKYVGLLAGWVRK